MAVKTKTAVVSKKLTDEIVANANRWTQFLKASATPYELLADEWYRVFEAQADVDSSTGENLVRLVDKAIEADKLLEGK